MIAEPRRLTISRWRWISRQRSTLLRALENEVIAEIRLSGRTLDIGGGEHFRYYSQMSRDGVKHSVNLTPDVKPTFLANLNGPLPVASASYDNVISFNTFEHVENDVLAFGEMLRVLKPGGTFHMTVPFLYRVHGRYGDFHRHSAEWWEGFIESCGLRSEQFRIVPLVWSPLSSGLAQLSWFGGGGRGRLVRRLVLGLPLLSGRRPADGQFALGYYISGTK
jgi:SAM-dependent methyltransferase